MTGTIEYGFEPLATLLDDGLDALAREHWRAIALDHSAVPLDVDWEAYARREQDGSWRAFTARRDGILVGYVGFFFFHPERYRSTLYINDDTIWVVPTERNRGLIWRGLVRAAMKELPRPAKLQFQVRVRHGGRVTARILENLGFELNTMLYSVLLK